MRTRDRWTSQWRTSVSQSMISVSMRKTVVRSWVGTDIQKWYHCNNHRFDTPGEYTKPNCWPYRVVPTHNPVHKNSWQGCSMPRRVVHRGTTCNSDYVNTYLELCNSAVPTRHRTHMCRSHLIPTVHKLGKDNLECRNSRLSRYMSG